MSNSVRPHRWQPTRLPIPGILQARTLEWVAISFSNAWKWKVKVKSLSRVRLPATPWTAAHQAPLSMGFSRQEYWSGVPLPSPCVYLLYFNFHLSITSLMLSNKHNKLWLFFLDYYLGFLKTRLSASWNSLPSVRVLNWKGGSSLTSYFKLVIEISITSLLVIRAFFCLFLMISQKSLPQTLLHILQKYLV